MSIKGLVTEIHKDSTLTDAGGKLYRTVKVNCKGTETVFLFENPYISGLLAKALNEKSEIEILKTKKIKIYLHGDMYLIEKVKE